MNVADSEVVASILGMDGFEVTEILAEADLVLMNTCSIRDNAEQKIISRLQYFQSLKKKGIKPVVGVLGCMAERVKDELIRDHHVDLVVGPDAYMDLPNLIGAVQQGQKAINIELSTTETYKDVIPTRLGMGRISGFISIMRGCNNFCTYCIVPYTRGRERSREAETILKELNDLWEKGYKEVTLLGQNVNSYSYENADGSKKKIITFFPADGTFPETWQSRHGETTRDAAEGKFTIRVSGENVVAVSQEILTTGPVADITIEDVPLEDVIAELFTSRA